MLFLGLLLKVLFVFAALGGLSLLVLLIIAAGQLFERKREERETGILYSEETDPEAVLSTLTVQQLERILDYLETEKEAAVFGFERMSKTHKEAAIIEVEKINERIWMVNNALGECRLKGTASNYSRTVSSAYSGI